jgi:hypothetical protein
MFAWTIFKPHSRSFRIRPLERIAVLTVTGNDVELQCNRSGFFGISAFQHELKRLVATRGSGEDS